MSEIHIIKEQQNPLLKRREIIMSYPYDNKITPRKEEAVKAISLALKTNEKLVFLKKIAPIFGQQRARVYANIYSDENTLKKFETINKKPKKAKEEKPKQEQKK